MNGCFSYAVKRLKIGTSGGNFFSLTDYFDNLSDKKNSYQSQGLRTLATKYATKMSYHLKKKINQTMTMTVPKIEREVHCQNMLQLLWNDKSIETIAYLSKVRAKNIKVQEMLATYLIKSEHTIIDYERRKLAGKTIGSGRTEKQNDILVAKRQKYNGMSWSSNGSSAITLITASYC